MPQDWSQDQINDFVREIVPYFEPAEGVPAVQQSWPIPDEPLNADGFRAMFQHMRGIFGRGGQPYWLRYNGSSTNTNSTNTMLLTVSTVTGTAEATLWGTFHRMTEDLVLEFPPVSSATEQHVVLEYDPVRAGEGGLPIEAKMVTSLTRTQGRDYLLLHTVDRRPNQLLADADITSHRPFVSAKVSYNRASEFPDPSTMLSGTEATAWRERAFYMSMQPNEMGPDGETIPSARWINLMDSGWIERLDSSYEYAGHGPRPATKKIGNTVHLRGNIAIRNGNSFNTGQNGGNGYRVLRLPEGFRADYTQQFVTAIGPALQQGYGNVWIHTNGDIFVYVSRTVRWVSLNGIQFDVPEGS